MDAPRQGHTKAQKLLKADADKAAVNKVGELVSVMHRVHTLLATQDAFRMHCDVLG